MIRPPEPRDRERLVALYRAFFAEDCIPASPRLPEFLDAMLAAPTTFFRVLEDEGEVVGLITATATRGAEFGLSVELEDLYVAPEARGRGHARRLLAEAMDHAEREGAGQVTLCVTPEAEAEQGLTSLYRRFGFEVSDRIWMLRDLRHPSDRPAIAPTPGP